MDTNQWTKFKLRVNINADIDVAYGSWASQAGLESWFLRSARFFDPQGKPRSAEEPLQEGDTYEWMWHGYPDSVKETGKVLKANGKDQFAFTFSLGCPVTISCYKEAGETIIELVESDLPTDEGTRLEHFVGDSKGWIFYLANLKSVLEGGLDLRNRKEELVNVITA